MLKKSLLIALTLFVVFNTHTAGMHFHVDEETGNFFIHFSLPGEHTRHQPTVEHEDGVNDHHSCHASTCPHGYNCIKPDNIEAISVERSRGVVHSLAWNLSWLTPEIISTFQVILPRFTVSEKSAHLISRLLI